MDPARNVSTSLTYRSAAKRGLRRLLVTLLGLLFGLALLESVLPAATEPFYESLEPELAVCEVLFVGPSYVKQQVLPLLVDEAALAAGRELRSCKFARESMKGFEMKRDLDIVLGKRWTKLRLVVFDVTLGPDSGFKPENRFKPRILRWHTWDFIPWYLSHLPGQRTEGDSHYLRLFEHIEHILANTLLVGRGPEMLAEATSKPQKVDARASRPYKEDLDLSELARIDSPRMSRLIGDRKRRASKTPPSVVAPWIEELHAVVERHGFVGDALIAPVWKPTFLPKGAFSNAGDPLVYAFDNPRKYPMLYEAGMHNKTGHLTSEGSRRYSRLLGTMLAERIGELK
jgi:hypothetical protein